MDRLTAMATTLKVMKFADFTSAAHERALPSRQCMAAA